ncbi:MAG: BRO family protein [Zoogloea sp.]|uniref:BRO-N domain-containing protein n=1 Tax=Zoogloea sp. TaxID=49181 RepID=UPI00262390F3|nr:BRO family protein [Zoogloea sp.]MDD2990622.1 BRO family protein [Zoogloea sp.]
MLATTRAPALAFRDTTFNPVSRNGQIWLTAAELAGALGYARTDLVTRVYERNAEEFSASMTLTVKLTVKGFGSGNSEKEVRIFSLRGAHLVAMFARTPVAAEFRRWVLDILDREVGAPVQAPTPKPTPPGVSRADVQRLRKQLREIATAIAPERVSRFVTDAEHRILIDCGLRGWSEGGPAELLYARSFVNDLRNKAIDMKTDQQALQYRYWLWFFQPGRLTLPDAGTLPPVVIDAGSWFPRPL